MNKPWFWAEKQNHQVPFESQACHNFYVPAQSCKTCHQVACTVMFSVRPNQSCFSSLALVRWQKQWKQPSKQDTGTSMERSSTTTRPRWEKVFRPWSRRAWWPERIFSLLAKWVVDLANDPFVCLGFFKLLSLTTHALALHLAAVVHFPWEVRGEAGLWEDPQWPPTGVRRPLPRALAHGSQGSLKSFLKYEAYCHI